MRCIDYPERLFGTPRKIPDMEIDDNGKVNITKFLMSTVTQMEKTGLPGYSGIH